MKSKTWQVVANAASLNSSISPVQPSSSNDRWSRSCPLRERTTGRESTGFGLDSRA
jgi:hypothetical protein